MGLLLYILLFIFLYYTIKVAWKFYGIYRKLHDVTKQFRDFGNSQGNGGYTAGGAQSSGSRQTSSGNSAYRGNTYSSSSTTPTGEVVEDRRTEDEINRKIFTREEGEYVDYEEVK